MTKTQRILVAIALLGFLVGIATSELAHSQEPFWTREQVILQSANVGLGIADSAITCHRLHQGWVEVTAPTQSCAGVTAWVLGLKGLQVFGSYKAHQWGMNKLAKAIPMVGISASGFAVTYDLWPRKGHKCSSSWPCEGK